MLRPTMIQDQMALEKLQKFLQAKKLPHTDIQLNGNLFIGYHDEQGNLIGRVDWNCMAIPPYSAQLQ